MHRGHPEHRAGRGHPGRLGSRYLRLIVSGVTVLAVALVGAGTWLTHSQRAFAATAPAYSHAWYVNNISNAGIVPTASPWGPRVGLSAMYNLGYNDGQWDTSNCTNSLVVLDFGQIDHPNGTWGTNYYNGALFIDTGQIIQAAEDYAFGWYEGTSSCPRLRLAIGTNNGTECPNDPSCDLSQGGQIWWGTAKNVSDWLSAKNFAWQISVAAADDMETEWDTYYRTTPFVDGFMTVDSGALFFFYDYGDATPGYSQCCGWTAPNIYHVAWGANWAVPLPEIYYNSECQTCEWANVETAAGAMTMQGSMSECTSPGYYNNQFPTTLTTCSSPYLDHAPSQSWSLLFNQQQTFGQTAMNYATNIKYQCQWWDMLGAPHDSGC